MKRISPHSRPSSLQKLDGRSKEARLLKRVRSDLIEHVGGKPSATQKALIERAAWMTLHVTMMDRKMMEGGAPAERDARQYLAWANTLTRTMRQLGIEGTTASAPSLDAYLNGRVA